MKWNLVLPCISALLLYHNPSFSKSNEYLPNSSWSSIFDAQGNWFLTLGAGAQFPEMHNHMNVSNGSEFPEPYNYDQFSINNDNGALIALSAGRRWQNNNYWFPSYSLSVFWQYFFKTQLNGTIMQYTLPEFTNYNYNLDFTANLLLVSGKMNLFKHGRFSPFINGGIGSAFNHVSNYNETALSGVTPRVSPGFRNANTNQFAYNIGAGIDVQFAPQLIFSVGYIYQDLGPISSGNGESSWADQSLNPGSYHANEILVSVTYLFGKEKSITK